MKLLKSFTKIVIAASLVASPVAAQAAVAERASTEVEGEALVGSSMALWFGLLALWVVVAMQIAKSDDPDPVSP